MNTTLVLDTGAFVSGLSGIDRYATSYICTTPSVQRELRDKKSIHLFNASPVKIHITEPSSAAIEKIELICLKKNLLHELAPADIDILALCLDSVLSSNTEWFAESKNHTFSMSHFLHSKTEFEASKPLKLMTDTTFCSTTDFAMQEILGLLGIHIVLAQKKVLRHSKRWALRCTACLRFYDQNDLTFCDHCGSHSFQKVVAVQENDGSWKYIVNSNYVPSLRGTKYSIPKPQGGRGEKNIILREDDYIMATKGRKPTAALAAVDDFFQKKRPKQQPVVGHGRRNPNESRRRSKRK